MMERAPVANDQMVPDLLKLSPMVTSTATDVETSITEPVVISDTFCRFVLLNKGILHSHSKITLAVTLQMVMIVFFLLMLELLL
jgi:hypothetical protein